MAQNLTTFEKIGKWKREREREKRKMEKRFRQENLKEVRKTWKTRGKAVMVEKEKHT